MESTIDYEQFCLGDKLGEGSFSVVHIIENKKTAKKYAAKIFLRIPNSHNDKIFLTREVNYISGMDHPAIYKFIDYSPIDPFNNKPNPIIITEYYKNGSIMSTIKDPTSYIDTWNDTKKLISIFGIAAGMKYLHSNDVIHRDLKPENILLDDSLHPKIADFGLSKQINHENDTMTPDSMDGFKGTPRYTAPEVIMNEKFTKSGDVYSFGMVLYAILEGKVPFADCKCNPFALFQRISTGRRPDFDVTTNLAYRCLIMRCWDNDPERRPTFEAIVEELKNNRGFITEKVDEREFFEYVRFVEEYQGSFKKRKIIKFNEIASSAEKSREKKFSYRNKEIDESLNSIDDSESIIQNYMKLRNTNISHQISLRKYTDQSDKNFLSTIFSWLGFNQEKLYPAEKLVQLSEKCQDLVFKAEEDPTKQYEIGKSLMEGLNDFPIDIDLGVKYMERSINGGCADSVLYLSNVFYEGKVISQDIWRAEKYLLTQYYKDNRVLFLYGKVLKKKKKIREARKEFKKGSEKGDCSCMYRYAKMLMAGEGGQQNVKEAMDYFNILKTKGHRKCLVYLKTFEKFSKYAQFAKLPKETQHFFVMQILKYNMNKTNNNTSSSSSSNTPNSDISNNSYNSNNNNSDKSNNSSNSYNSNSNSKSDNSISSKNSDNSNSSYNSNNSNNNNSDKSSNSSNSYNSNNNSKSDNSISSKNTDNSNSSYNSNNSSNVNSISSRNSDNSSSTNDNSSNGTKDDDDEIIAAKQVKMAPNEIEAMGAKNLFRNSNFVFILQLFESIFIDIMYSSKSYEDVLNIMLQIKKRGKNEIHIRVTIDGIRKIPANFDYRKIINDVVIEKPADTIADKAFQNDPLLEQLELPSSMISIGHYSFNKCSSLRKISIPSSVTSIGIFAFEGCTSLTEVTIPSSVTMIGYSCFADCSSLKQILIPSSVTLIRSCAFYKCSSLEQVTIPSSVETFGDDIFNGVKSLTILGDITRLPQKLFFKCQSLTKIYILAPVTSIEENCFNSCRSLKEVSLPASLETIGDYSFDGCSSLEQIQIPLSVTSIGQFSFNGCSSLPRMKISSPLVSINEHCFEGCSLLEEVKIPPSVTSIGTSAFSNCSSLKKIEIPASVTSISDSAFFKCSSLLEITIPPSVATIKKDCFTECTSLIQVTIPPSVVSIEKYAFCNCSSLKKVTIPPSVTSIGSWAFRKCSSLSQITIPSSVFSIGDYAFNECSSLESISFEKPSFLTSIEGKMFSGCRALEQIEIPSSVTTIKDFAFYKCQSLKKVTIPSSVASIGSCAFNSCSSMMEIEIPASVFAIGDFTFSKCSSLQQVSFGIPSLLSSIGDGAFSECSQLSEVEIPSSVSSIGQRAFDKCDSLRKVSIPSSVKSVGEDVFPGSTNVEKI